MSWRFKKQKHLAEEVCRCIQEQLDACIKTTEKPKLSSKDIHQTRKSLKRIRAGLRLLRPTLGEKLYHQKNDFYRDIGRSLSSIRDLSILSQTLGMLLHENQGLFPKYRQLKVKRALKNYQRNALIESSLTPKKIENIHTKLKKELKDFEKIKIKKKIRPKDLRVAFSKAEKAFLKACELQTDHSFHECRKQSKYLRYQLELFEGIKPSLHAAVKDLRNFTDSLGSEHDLAVLKSVLSQSKIKKNEKVIFKCFEDSLLKKKTGLRTSSLALGTRLFQNRNFF